MLPVVYRYGLASFLSVAMIYYSYGVARAGASTSVMVPSLLSESTEEIPAVPLKQ